MFILQELTESKSLVYIQGRRWGPVWMQRTFRGSCRHHLWGHVAIVSSQPLTCPCRAVHCSQSQHLELHTFQSLTRERSGCCMFVQKLKLTCKFFASLSYSHHVHKRYQVDSRPWCLWKNAASGDPCSPFDCTICDYRTAARCSLQHVPRLDLTGFIWVKQIEVSHCPWMRLVWEKTKVSAIINNNENLVSHMATVLKSISRWHPGRGYLLTTLCRTARDDSAVPAPVHIEKAVLPRYNHESFSGSDSI